MFSAFPFSGCFCEDFENKYAYLQVERGNPKVYAISKTITIMLVAELTMMFGVMLYVSLLHLRLPWFDAEDAICQSAVTLGGFRGIISNGHYLLYFALFGLQYGIMAGVLALLFHVFFCKLCLTIHAVKTAQIRMKVGDKVGIVLCDFFDL